MVHKFFQFRIFGFINTGIGILALLFSFLGGLFSPDLVMSPVFTEKFFIFLMFPMVLLVSGIAIITGMRISRMLSVFVSCFMVLYCIAGILMTNPPDFVSPTGNPDLVFVFHYLLPGTGIAFFGTEAIIGFLLHKKNRESDGTQV